MDEPDKRSATIRILKSMAIPAAGLLVVAYLDKLVRRGAIDFDYAASLGVARLLAHRVRWMTLRDVHHPADDEDSLFWRSRV